MTRRLLPGGVSGRRDAGRTTRERAAGSPHSPARGGSARGSSDPEIVGSQSAGSGARGDRLGPRQRQARRRERGERGEAIAVDWYESRGWTVLQRNWTCRAGEIDLVVRRGDVVAIVEVRTRACSFRRGTPVQTVQWRKRRSVERAAGQWVRTHQPHGLVVRIDVLSVDARTTPARITHYPAAVEPRALWF